MDAARLPAVVANPKALAHRLGFAVTGCNISLLLSGIDTGKLMICPYCQNVAELVTGADVYPHRPDLHHKFIYRCAPCDALVGCHPGTKKPLGRLANAELRKAKQAAHAAFDPLWQSGGMKRQAAYGWLAGQLGIDRQECHIGMMDVAMCKRVVEVCSGSETQSLSVTMASKR
jgi:hypothetical protein